MSTFSEKIRTLRKNRGWTQAQLAEALSLSESAIQKWEVDKNEPPVSELQRLAEIFSIPAAALLDENIDIPKYYKIEELPADYFSRHPDLTDATPHQIYDANLRKGATLHRFLNKAGVPYSAIYIGSRELMSCERNREQGMVDYWNQE